MKADYDSRANALGIELTEVDRWDDGDGFDDPTGLEDHHPGESADG